MHPSTLLLCLSLGALLQRGEKNTYIFCFSLLPHCPFILDVNSLSLIEMHAMCKKHKADCGKATLSMWWRIIDWVTAIWLFDSCAIDFNAFIFKLMSYSEINFFVKCIVHIMTTTAHLFSTTIKSPLQCLSGRQAVLFPWCSWSHTGCFLCHMAPELFTAYCLFQLREATGAILAVVSKDRG